jgi:nicotinamidase/pyrazinamidase
VHAPPGRLTFAWEGRDDVHAAQDFVRYAGFAGLGGLGTVPGALFAAAAIKPGPKSALIVVDVQNCFVDGGTLPVKGGADVVPVINKLSAAFENVVVTQDWHTPGHVSFASAHQGKKPFETTKLPYGNQVLWPDHCVQGSDDAALLKGLSLPKAQLIIRKGYHQSTDSYSAFMEADGKTSTGLAAYLRRTASTASTSAACHRFLRRLDRARRAQGGFKADGDRGRVARHRPQRLAQGRRWDKMTKAGVKRIQSSDIVAA